MRFKHVCFLAMGMLAACAPHTAVNPSSNLFPKEQDYLFTIDNEPVFSREFSQVLLKNQNIKENREPHLTEIAYAQNFELFLHYKLKVKEAENRGMDQTEEFKREFQDIKEDIKRPFLLKYSVEEEEIRKAYSRIREMVKASHILVKFPPNASDADSLAVFDMAKNLKEKAINGADFNELAFQYSDDPSAKNNKGNLGYFTALQMVYPFEEAAYGLQPGQISDPVLSGYGFHLIRLEDRIANPGEIKISHILLRTDSAEPDSEEQAKRKIYEIHSLLQKRNDAWQEYSLAYSEDRNSINQGGQLPWLGLGSLVPELERTAFSMRKLGEISHPVKTKYGYHIIRLEDTRPIPPFEEMKGGLKAKIIKDSRSIRLQPQIMEMQMEKYGFKENGKLLEKLEPIVNEDMVGGIDQLYLSLSEKNLLDSSLMVLQGESQSVRKLVYFIKEGQQSVITGPGNYFYPWFNKFKETSLNEVEEKDLLANNDEYKILVNEYREGILLFNLMNELVWQKALLDSVGQLAYFETYADRYQWADRIPALIVKMEKEEFTAKVRRFLSDKDYHPKLMRRLEDQFLIEEPLIFSVEQDLYIKEDHPILRKLAINKKYHELFLDEMNYFVVLGETVPAGPKRFEESRGQVIQDYQKHLDSILVEGLEKKYSVKINEVEKERVFHNLAQKK